MSEFRNSISILHPKLGIQFRKGYFLVRFFLGNLYYIIFNFFFKGLNLYNKEFPEKGTKKTEFRNSKLNLPTERGSEGPPLREVISVQLG